MGEGISNPESQFFARRENTPENRLATAKIEAQGAVTQFERSLKELDEEKVPGMRRKIVKELYYSLDMVHEKSMTFRQMEGVGSNDSKESLRADQNCELQFVQLLEKLV